MVNMALHKKLRVRNLTRRSTRTFWSHSGCLSRPESPILAIKSTAMEHFLCKAWSTYPNVLIYCMLQACHASRFCWHCLS